MKDVNKKRERQKISKDDITKYYDEGKDNFPIRDTFRNVLDTTLAGIKEDEEGE